MGRMKILDLAKLFVADAPMKKTRNLVLPPSQSTLNYGSENRPWVRGLRANLLYESFCSSLTFVSLPHSYSFFPLSIFTRFMPWISGFKLANIILGYLDIQSSLMREASLCLSFADCCPRSIIPFFFSTYFLSPSFRSFLQQMSSS